MKHTSAKHKAMSGSPYDLYKNLKDRDLKKEGIFIGEGKYIVERMIHTGCDILSILCTHEHKEYFSSLSQNRIPVLTQTKAEIKQIIGFPFHRGVLAAAKRPVFPDVHTYLSQLPSPASVVVLPSVSEAENIGSIIRTASAFSLDGIITGPGCMDPYSRKAIRCSMGAVFTMPMTGFSDHDRALSLLHQYGFHSIGTTLSDTGTSLEGFHFPQKSALIFGHEAEGLKSPWDTSCDTYLHIRISERVDSLNVGIAAGIVLYALSIGKNGKNHTTLPLA